MPTTARNRAIAQNSIASVTNMYDPSGKSDIELWLIVLEAAEAHVALRLALGHAKNGRMAEKGRKAAVELKRRDAQLRLL